MPGTNTEVLHRWFDEVWNNKCDHLIEELLSPDAPGHGLPLGANGEPNLGPDGFRILYHAFCHAFPNINFTIESTVEQGDKIAALCTVRGRHTGEGIGLAPTQRPVEFSGMCILRIEDGKIREAWNQYDFMGMYQQLGALSLTLG
jgi:predicted ester cyclase